MLFTSFQARATALALGLAIASLSNVQSLSAVDSNDLIAKGSVSHQFIRPAQLFAQDQTMQTLTLSEPISFHTIDIRENIKIEKDKSVFKIKQSGFYEIDASVTITTATNDQQFTGVILINDKSYIYFQDTQYSYNEGSVEVNPSASLYLRKGDKVSVALLNATSDSLIGSRTLEITASSNTKN